MLRRDLVERGAHDADLAVHHPAGPTTSAPASACAMAISAYRTRVASLSTAPSGVEHAAVAVVGELVEAQVGHHDERVADLGARRRRTARLRMPSGSVAPLPTASRVAGHAEQHDAAEPRGRRLRDSRAQRGARVLHDAGHRRDRRRGVEPLAHEQRQHETGRVQPGLGDEPTQRRRAPQPPRTLGREAHDQVALRRAPPRRLLGRQTGSPCSSAARRSESPCSASASASAATDGVSARTSTRRPCSSAVFAVAGPMHATTVRGVRLARDADQVAHRARRGEQHRVEAAGLDRLAGLGRRRCRTHGAVGRDVLDLPAELDEPGDEGLGGDVGARQEDAVDRVEDRRRTRGKSSSRPDAGLLAARHEVGAHAERDRAPRRSARRRRRP